MPARRLTPKRQAKKTSKADCVIPGPVPSAVLPRLKVRPEVEHEERHVREYMESQAPDERVIHLEKVASERVFDRKHDVWDVHTNSGRWWVITGPTNLYSQEH